MSGSAFRGGERLTAYLRQAVNKVRNATEVRIGFLEGSTETDGTSVPFIAATQEFGAPRVGIPSRPFFRTMIAQHKSEWGAEVAAGMKANDYNASLTLNQMGMHIGNELRASIVATNEPPLSPVTVMLRKMRKGKMDAPITWAMVQEARRRVAAGESTAGESTKPLIYTGTMYQSVDYEVS